MDKPILITGAAGFVGSRLAKRLLERGRTVIGLDNFHDYYDVALKRLHLVDLQAHDNFTFVQQDLRDASALRQLFEQHDFSHVAHLAAMAAVRYSAKFPLIYAEVNVQGTVNLMDAGRLTTRPMFVLASTGSVYGSDTPVPFQEDAAAAMPLAPYPASKRAMELFAHSFAHLYGMDITCLRFFNVYGPHGRPDMMPWQWTTQILRDQPLTLYGAGELQRDWTYIDDILDGFLAALERPMKFEIMNLGGSNPVKNIEFVHALETILGKKATIIDTPTPASEPPITYANIAKARRLLGYEPKVAVRQGLERFIAWLRETGMVPELAGTAAGRRQ